MFIYDFHKSSQNSITAAELIHRLVNNSFEHDGSQPFEKIIVLDVRNPCELEGSLGKIENAINISVQDLEHRISELKKFRGKEIAVICRTGNRSQFATKFLNENGFNARNVVGGMVEYRALEK